MNEIELAGEADRLEKMFRSGKGVFLYPPGDTTPRERELVELELRRRGCDVKVSEGTIQHWEIAETEIVPPGRLFFRPR